MQDFEVRATPVEAWSLELRGSDRVQFNGPLFQSCIQEAVACASRSGCLTPGKVRLTQACAETLAAHAAVAD